MSQPSLSALWQQVADLQAEITRRTGDAKREVRRTCDVLLQQRKRLFQIVKVTGKFSI